MAAPVTAIYAAFFTVFIMALAFRVVSMRFGKRVGLGAGGHADLRRAIRVHGNAVEVVPVILLLMLLLELNGAPAALLHGAGGVTVVARLLHAHGLARRTGHSFGRFYGTLASWIVMCGLAAANVWWAIG